MSLALLIPLSILMGVVALAAFFWAMRSEQFDDLEGASWRILEQSDPMEAGGRAPHAPAPSAPHP
ncbi:MAG: cbb3-type cytochrome oxidase assembly protein CcoS [Rubellimicrobium sp.]|nr:cbb3-type cytochrome oxidase assembly protein CcoS [Rubellimicrobium sp.]